MTRAEKNNEHRIAVIDDNRSWLREMAMYLGSLELKNDSYISIQSFKDAVENGEKYKLILCDFHFPGEGNGGEIFEFIRLRAPEMEEGFWIVTALNDARIAHDLIREDIYHVLAPRIIYKSDFDRLSTIISNAAGMES